MRGSLLALLLMLPLVLGGCQSSVPEIGEIEINSDLPILHRGTLPIGITLGGKSCTGRDLLSSNLLLNSSFDLAPIPEDCRYHLETRTIVTPNGYTTDYPAVAEHRGWKVIEGRAQVIPAQDGGYYLSLAPSLDSLQRATLLHTGSSFSVSIGESYILQLKGRITGRDSLLYLALVDTALHPLTTPQRLLLSDDWQSHTATLTVERSSEQAFLWLQSKAPAPIELDSLHLQRAGWRAHHGLSHELWQLLDSIAPPFIRYPEGRVSNGYYPSTYPHWREGLDPEHPQHSKWTYYQQEHTGEFNLAHLISLARSLQANPIYVANIGITDITAQPRSENIKMLEERADDLVALGHSLTEHMAHDTLKLSPALQLGYDMSKQDYLRRFAQLSERIEAEQLPLKIIAAAELTQLQRHSPYLYDASSKEISSPNLKLVAPNIDDNAAMLRQPTILGECRFSTMGADDEIPPIVLRAAFLIEAERYSSHIKSLSLAPLLADTLSSASYPLISVDGSRYTPTPLYTLLHLFTSYRGIQLREVPQELLHTEETTDGEIAPLYVSLTSNEEGTTYYLKAVNTTRHPLPYRIVFRGRDFAPHRVHSTHLLPDVPSSRTRPYEMLHYRKEERSNRLSPTVGMTYEFAPYEVVFFAFTS